MADWGSWIDKKIREAQERGEFDNLAGQGRPLDLDDDGFEDPEWRLANRVLKTAGFAPDWIELDRGIREGLEAARRALIRTRDWRAEKLAALGGRRDVEAQRDRDLVAGERRRAAAAFVETIGDLNSQIATLNLKVPLLTLQRVRLDAARELRRIDPETPKTAE